MVEEIDKHDNAVQNVVLDTFDPDAMTETVQHSRIDHVLLRPGHFRGHLL